MEFFSVMLIMLLAYFSGYWMITGRRAPLPPMPKKKKAVVMAAAEEPLSWPAEQVMNVYNSLPEVNRPTADLRDTLEAMDQSYGGVEAINKAYNEWNGYSSLGISYTWGRYGYERNARPGSKQYRELLYSLQSIKDALRAQEREFMMAGISHKLDRVAEIMEQAKNEKEIIEETTALVINKEIL